MNDPWFHRENRNSIPINFVWNTNNKFNESEILPCPFNSLIGIGSFLKNFKFQPSRAPLSTPSLDNIDEIMARLSKFKKDLNDYKKRKNQGKESSASKEDINHLLWLKAFYSFTEGKYEKAISKFSKCIDNGYINSEYFKEDTDPFYWIGMCNFESQDFKSAISSFTKSLNYFSENHTTFYHLACCSFELKDLKGLKKYITKFFGLVSQKDKSPINSTALFFRGHCFKFENELQLAAEDFSKLLKMEFRKWNNFDEDFLDIKKNNHSFRRGKYYYELGIGELAIDETDLVLRYFPYDAQALFNKALYHRKLNQLQDSFKKVSLAIDNCTDESSNEIFIKFKNELIKKQWNLALL